MIAHLDPGAGSSISDFQSSADAIAAIHGPVGSEDDGSEDDIGTPGAEVSHGCVRLHLDDLKQLRDVRAGSPIDVVIEPPRSEAS